VEVSRLVLVETVGSVVELEATLVVRSHYQEQA
jgi:hypothetical protein